MRADDGVHGEEVWVSDGTDAGTRMLADLNPGADSSSPAMFTRVGDWLLFKAREPQHGEELWRLRLTAAAEPPGEPVPVTEPTPVPATPTPPGSGPTEPTEEPTPAEAVPTPVPDEALKGLGCGVTSGLQGSLCSGLLLLGWLRARRPRRG